MSEVFTFDVSYFTTFSDLEKLREEMLAFVMAEKRHFQPVFDVSVQGTFKSNLSLRTCAAYTLSRNAKLGFALAFAYFLWLCRFP